MKIFIETFKKLIEPLDKDNNMVISGSCVLKAHGLILNREPQDLDIIVYKPTLEQKKYIEQISPLQLDDIDYDRPSTNVSDAKQIQFSYKFKKNGLIINIIFQETKEMPVDLLHYLHDGTYYKIQNINEVVKAKRECSYEKGEGSKNLYLREKDIKDFIDLKNSNFNLQ